MEKPRYDVFLSHATPDKPAVEELARRLKAQKLEPWLDKWNLVPGEPWQEAIEQALESCATCAVFIGPGGNGPWQNEEMRAAIDARVQDRSRAFRVIPVLLPRSERGEPSRLPAFLRATTWVEFRGTLDDEKALHRLISGIRGIAPGADPGEAVAEGKQPYRGLQVFDVADAPFFFGREALTEWLLDKLRTDRSGNRFLAIVGPSGSGKSSLARAGLVASLKRGEISGSDAWAAAICKPGAQPLESLAIALSSAARLGDSPSAVLNLIRDLAANPNLLHLTTRLALRDAPADRRLVVVVDQFEEVFTLCPDEAQRQAIIANLLHAATAADGQTVVVLTLRADFYGRCATYPDLATAVSDRQSLVGPMTRDELQSAIERPAYLAGCELEGGLTDLLLNEVESQPGSLPLLEHALLQIWQKREGGRRLTIAAYREIGGVAGALEKHAEEVYSGFSEEEKEVCRLIFLRLVQVDEQGRATKRRLGLEELPGEGVVARLTQARLLTTDQEKRPTVELAHEALLANWERLKQWIGDDRDALRTRRRLDEAVAEWIGKDRVPSFLLEGGRLAQAEEWAARHEGEIGEEAREFLAASIAERDRERQRELDQAKALEEEQRRRADAEHQRAEEQGQARRRLRKWTIVSIATAAVATAAALAVFYFQQVADRQVKIDLAGHLAERSNLALKSDPMLGLLLSIEAVRVAASAGQPHLSSAEGALRAALFNSRGIPLPTGKIRAASLSADKKILALWGTDDFISVWSLEPDREPIKIASIHNDQPSGSMQQIAVSSKGHWMLIADQVGTSRLLRFGEAKEADSTVLNGEDWLAGNDPFSPDGRWLLTRGEAPNWKLREIPKPDRPVVFLKMSPQALAFSQDGRWLAAAESGVIRLFDLRAPGASSLSIQLPHDDRIDALAFSSDSQWLVAEQAFEAEAWRVHPDPSPGPWIHLNHCVWDTPNGPAFSDPALASHLLNFASCLFPGIPSAVPPGVKPPPTERGPELDGGDRITAAAIDSQGKNIMAGTMKGILETTTYQSFENFQAGPVRLLAFHGQRLIGQSANEAPRSFGEEIARLEPSSVYHAHSLAIPSPDGLQLKADEKSQQLIVSGPHGAWPLSYKGDPNHDLWAFSSDNQWLVTVSQGQELLAWHLEKGGRPSTSTFLPTQHFDLKSMRSFAFSPDGHWLAIGNEAGESRVWNLRTPNREPLALVNHSGSVNALEFNREGDQIASAGEDGVVRVSRIDDDHGLQPLPSQPVNRGEQIPALAFLEDGRLAIGALSGRVVLWKPGQTSALENKSSQLFKLVGSLKGVLLAGMNLEAAQIWHSNGHGGLLRAPVSLPTSGLNISAAFTLDGHALITYQSLSEALRWELRTDELLATACRAAGRNLTEREWKEYVSESYQDREPCPELPKAYD